MLVYFRLWNTINTLSLVEICFFVFDVVVQGSYGISNIDLGCARGKDTSIAGKLPVEKGKFLSVLVNMPGLHSFITSSNILEIPESFCFL